ncbi:hypothetical protein [Modestobacter sp. I12A-02662]
MTVVLLRGKRHRLERHLSAVGMMVIVGVLKQTGLFDYLAVWAAQR